jgi:serine/threonine-protein kinase
VIGKTVSHYKITEKLGSGGMGVVYKAQDLKLDRFVALKFLPPHLTSSEEEKQRFIHEAKAASSLDHNNICNIYEIDETEDGQLFISMAYYEGETLDKKIKEKPLPIEEAINITIQIAQGLAIAHEKEIVHRDVKPANIMLTKKGVVKILDFGLAKLSTQTKLTKESTTFGTVSYMSPEQAKGDQVDYRTDIWSLGVIIYEMLTGQLPFKGEYESAVIYSIMNDTQKPVTGLRSGIPMELERIINKCLQKNPAERYQHVDELIVDLQGFKKSESTGIPTVKEPPKKRFKSVLLPVAILSFLILIVVGYFLIQPGDKSETGWENSIAVLPFDNISKDPEQEYFCDGMTEQIISNLSRLPQLKVTGRQSVMKFKDSDKLISEIGKELDVAYVLESSIRKSGSRIRVTAQLISTKDNFHVWSKDFDRDYRVELFDLQDELSQAIATSLLTALSPQEEQEIKTNRPSNTEAYELYMKGRHFNYYKFCSSFSEEHFTTSEQLYKESIKIDPKYADAYAGLAELYAIYWMEIEGVTANDSTYLHLASTYIDSALRLDSQSTEVHIVKTTIFLCRAQYDSAYKSIKNALKFDRNHPYAIAYLGWVYEHLGLLNLTIKYITDAIEINPLDPWYYNVKARSYEAIKEYQLAEINFKKALQIESENRGALFRYAFFLIILNKYADAKTLIDKYADLYPDSYYTYILRSLLYAMSGDKKRALELLPDIRDTGWLYWTFYAYYIAYLYLDMKEEAIDHLIKYSENILYRDIGYLRLKNLPIFDPIRSDPRFQEILAKHKEIYKENLAKYGDIEELIN